MELHFKTSSPKNLKNEIIKFVEDENLATWSVLNQGGVKYLKHTKQWGEKGVINLTADPTNGYLKSKVLKFKEFDGEVEDFEGYYLGRFCELMFVNYPEKFSSIENK